MSLLDDLAKPPQRARTFLGWLNDQTPEIINALETVAMNNDWSDHALEQLLRKHKAPVSKDALTVWRADVAAR